MDLQYLREATRSEHEATEAAMPLLGPHLTRERYAHILRCLLPILRSWESWSAENVPQRLRPMLEPRRRSHLLLADLHTLGGEIAEDHAGQGDSRDPTWSSILDMSEKPPKKPASRGTVREYEAGFLGALYVVEGSTLGGRILARQVETVLELTPGQGNAYFQGHGAATGALWKEVTAEIAAVPEEMSVRLLSTARRTFTAFRQALEGGGQPHLRIAAEPTCVETATPAAAATNAVVAGTPQRNQASKLS